MIVQRRESPGASMCPTWRAHPRAARPFVVRALGDAQTWSSAGAREADLCAPGLEVSVFSAPASGDRGGDICHLAVRGDGRVTRTVLADVTGHGHGVAHMTRFVHEAITLNLDAGGGDELLRAVNEIAVDRGPFAMTTAVVMDYRAGSRELDLTYAGHAPVLLRRADTGRLTPIEPPAPALADHGPTRNVALAVCDRVAFDSVRVQLAPGDRLFLYTDGATDARDMAGRPFGESGIRAALDQAGGRPLPRVRHALAAALRLHTGHGFGHDDVTFVALEVA